MTTRKVTVNWHGLGGGATPSATGPVARPRRAPGRRVARAWPASSTRARSAGPPRRTSRSSPTARARRSTAAAGDCGAPADAAPAARYGLLRDNEARDAMAVLGLNCADEPQHHRDDLPRLSRRPDAGRRPGRDDADDATASRASSAPTRRTSTRASTTCNGDFRYLLTGQHSQFLASSLRADLDSLLRGHRAGRRLHARHLRRPSRSRRDRPPGRVRRPPRATCRSACTRR